MTQSYSLDLRVRVVAFVEARHFCRAAARHFGVSDSFAIKLLQRHRTSGSPTPARQGRRSGRRRLSPYVACLIQTVEAKPVRMGAPFGHWKTTPSWPGYAVMS